MSQWTVDTLKEYVDRRIESCAVHTNDKFASIDAIFIARDEAQKIAMDAAQTAVDKAERLADVRAENQDRMAADTKKQQNEWRGAMNDLQATMLTRKEFDIQHQMLNERFDQHVHSAEKEMSQLRERGNSARTQTIILTCLMTAVFSMLIYLVFLHIN